MGERVHAEAAPATGPETGASSHAVRPPPPAAPAAGPDPRAILDALIEAQLAGLLGTDPGDTLVAALQRLAGLDEVGARTALDDSRRDPDPLRLAALERLAAATALAAADRRLRHILAGSGIQVWEWDLEHDLFVIDPPLAAAGRSAVLSALREALAGSRTTIEGSVRHDPADGTRLRIELRGCVLARNLEGGALRAAGVAIDDGAREVREEQCRWVVDHARDIVCASDFSGRFLRVNPAASRILGWSEEELLAHPFLDLVHPEDVAATQAAMVALQRGEPVLDFVNRYRRRDGEWVHIAWSAYPLGDLGIISSVGRDVTDQVAREARERLAGSVFAHAQEAILICDPDGRVLEANPAFTQLTAFSPEEMRGQSLETIVAERHGAQFLVELLAKVATEGAWEGETWNRRRDGSLFIARLRATAVRDREGRAAHLIVAFADITQLKAQQERLEALAHYDPLTRLPNRVLLADRIGQAIEQARRGTSALAVCFLDLDGFKPVNDLYGHEAGDEVLVEVAHRLRATLRGADTVARVGGDEFVLLLPEIGGLADCERAAERVLAAVRTPMTAAGHPVDLSTSIGIARFPGDGDDADALLLHADQAMYRAKESGRGRYAFYDHASDTSERGLRAGTDRIARALADGEFRLLFVPRIRLDDGSVAGFEVQPRWMHPSEGALLPDRFLPLIEETEVELKFARWLLESAVQQGELWRQAGIDVALACPVTPGCVRHGEFAEIVAAALALAPDAPHGRIELEFEEPSGLDDLEQPLRVLRRCRTAGARLVLAGFGRGATTLGGIRQIGIDGLKLARSVVRAMAGSAADRGVVAAAARLMQGLGGVVVADGIDAVDLVRPLLDVGCLLGQGRALGEPLHAAEVPRWLSDRATKPVEGGGPQAVASRPQPGPGAEGAEGGETGDILIVDDNPNNLRLLTGMLRGGGHKVRAALSGELALRAVELARPDLVLMDVRMPGMDGLEVCRRLHALPQRSEVPVIFVSALQQPEDKVRAFDAGGADFIAKPLNADEVLARVRTHLAAARGQARLRGALDVLEERVVARTRRFADANRRLQETLRRERTLRELLLAGRRADPAAFAPEALRILAREAGWQLPTNLFLLLLRDGTPGGGPLQIVVPPGLGVEQVASLGTVAALGGRLLGRRLPDPNEEFGPRLDVVSRLQLGADLPCTVRPLVAGRACAGLMLLAGPEARVDGRRGDHFISRVAEALAFGLLDADDTGPLGEGARAGGRDASGTSPSGAGAGR